MRAIHLEQTIAAPPHRVYRAWLEPALVRRWMVPDDCELTRVEIEERAGGPYRTWKSKAGVLVGGFDSELLELVPDKRLLFRWGFRWVGTEGWKGPSLDSRLTVTFVEAGADGTRLTLVHEQLERLTAAKPHIARYVGVGWRAYLAKLASALGG